MTASNRLIICADCGKEKRHEAKGLCHACYNRACDKANPEKKKVRDAAYYITHADVIKERTAEYQLILSQTNPKKFKESQTRRNKRYRLRHPERVKEAGVRSYYANPEKRMEKARKGNLKQYNISVEQYEELLIAQNGVCAICGSPPGRRRLAVDHSHITGRIRGLLCDQCNLGLGSLERQGFLAGARKYLGVEMFIIETEVIEC